jgi:hypothetical protein
VRRPESICPRGRPGPQPEKRHTDETDETHESEADER